MNKTESKERGIAIIGVGPHIMSPIERNPFAPEPIILHNFHAKSRPERKEMIIKMLEFNEDIIHLGPKKYDTNNYKKPKHARK